MEPVKVMEITPGEQRKIQLIQLDILKEFDRICRKYNLKYTLCGGSLLGAVRHKGFIPWDDDVDVTLLRADYEKFCEICKTELDAKKYFLQTMDTDPEYRLIYGRILLNGTAYVRAGQEHMKAKNGIFIDIFPRDGFSDLFLIGWLQSKLGLLMRKTLYSPVGKYRGRNKVSRVVFAFLSFFPRDFIVSLDKLIRKLNFRKDTERVCCYGLMGDKEKKKLNLGRKAYRAYKRNQKNESKKDMLERKDREKGLKRVFFEEIIELPFEDMSAMVTAYYDIWLKTNYDDYMKLPPENKRVIHQTVSYYCLGEYDKTDEK